MKNKILTIIIILFFASNYLLSQNFNDALRLSLRNNWFGARASSMGSSFIGISDDYSASYYNPAGLFQIKRMEFHGGLNYQSLTNNTAFFGKQSSFTNTFTKINDLGFVFPFPTIRGSFVIAFGYNRNNNFNEALAFSGYNNGNTSMIQALLGKGDVSYLLYLTDSTGNYTPIQGKLYQSGNILSSGSESNWVLSGAVEVARDLAVGLTLGIISGELERDRDYLEEDIYNIYNATVRTDPDDPRTSDFRYMILQESLKWELTGLTSKVGLMYRTRDFLRLGMTIKFPSIFSIKEHYLVNGHSGFANFSADINPPLESKLEYEIYTPFEFGIGFSISKLGLTISGDLNFIDYKQMEFKGLSPSKVASNNREIKQFFRNVVDYSIGAEYNLFDSGLRLRGGYSLKNSPFKDDPSDFNRTYFTGGLGYITSEGFAIDFAYIGGKWKNVGDNYGVNVSRTYQDIKTTDIVFSVSFRF